MGFNSGFKGLISVLVEVNGQAKGPNIDAWETE